MCNKSKFLGNLMIFREVLLGFCPSLRLVSDACPELCHRMFLIKTFLIAKFSHMHLPNETTHTQKAQTHKYHTYSHSTDKHTKTTDSTYHTHTEITQIHH